MFPPERRVGREGRGSDTRQARTSREQRVGERRVVSGIRVAGRGSVSRAVRTLEAEPGIDPCSRMKLEQERRAHQQHARQRHFGQHEQRTGRPAERRPADPAAALREAPPRS